MATQANLNDQTLTFNGLGTFNVTIPVAGNYNVLGNITLPTLSSGDGASAVVTTITQNSTLQYTGAAGATGFQTVLTCAAGDIIHIALASSAASDNKLNVIRTTVQIFLTAY